MEAISRFECRVLDSSVELSSGLVLINRLRKNLTSGVDSMDSIMDFSSMSGLNFATNPCAN